MRALLLGRLARARSLYLPRDLQTLVLLEFVLDLHLVGYPYSYLRALIHSIPTLPAATVARRAVRAWGAPGGTMVNDPKGQGHGNGGGRNRWGQQQGGNDKGSRTYNFYEKKKKSRSSSSSSSSS